ncbi:MAG: hypothetical protein K2H40_08115 [Lachnospiraceae bacterium]|nr:hypothetical protein [Lachnospiraceae bacterium]
MLAPEGASQRTSTICKANLFYPKERLKCGVLPVDGLCRWRMLKIRRSSCGWFVLLEDVWDTGVFPGDVCCGRRRGERIGIV